MVLPQTKKTTAAATIPLSVLDWAQLGQVPIYTSVQVTSAIGMVVVNPTTLGVASQDFFGADKHSSTIRCSG